MINEDVLIGHASRLNHDIQTIRPEWRVEVRLQAREYVFLVFGDSGEIVASANVHEWVADLFEHAPEQALADLAEEVQSDLMQSGISTWPECPRHVEPLFAGFDYEKELALWCCTDNDIEFVIGSLPDS